MAINNNKQDASTRNPWKGLNFYKEGEVLYGRDDEIQSLILYITNNIQTVLYGKSGIGKSSIINAGVFPIARKEGLFPIPIRLKHDKDTSYIAQIKAVFLESGIGIREILPAINEQEESLWEYLHRHSFFNVETKKSVRPLIVFDQFEEIFTLQQDEKKKKDFFSELADLLNEVTPQYIINANNDSGQTKNQKPKSKNSAFVLDLGSDEAEGTAEYLSESLFNIVFTIREDFLSYLERYTKFIPVMKSNRYALLPLNEEQAKDIIMKPMPGLVNIDVAKLIIEKVTGRTDFNLGDAPEIDVDAAVLSLYLSRLFIKKGEGSERITAELVDESSKYIIKDFYEESISHLSDAEVEKIEDQLITYDGRRNNVSKNDLISEGVSESTIHTLVEDKKLLRQFSYQDDIRVEYMHDILCPIVNTRIEQREAARLQAEENAKAERHNRWIKLGIYTLIPLLLVSLGFIIYLVYANIKFKNEKGLGVHQQFVISLSEDSLVTANNDFWKANLQVVAINGTSRTMIIDTLINKAIVSNTYTFSSDTSKVFHVNVKFGEGSKYQDIDTTYTIGQLTDNASIALKIRFQEAKFITYSSSVVMELDGKYKSVQDAIVVIRDKIQRTDDKGIFVFNLEDSLNSDDVLYIIKKGFTSFEESDILENGKLRERFVLSMADSLSYFDQRCAVYDTLRWEYSTVKEKYPNGSKVTMADGQTDDIAFYAKTAGRTPDGKYKLEGYYYFVSEYNALKRHGSEHHSYHLFTGWMDPIPLKTTDVPFKTFGLESFDVANNKQRINGKYWRSGFLSGEIVGHNSLIGEFGGNITK